MRARGKGSERADREAVVKRKKKKNVQLTSLIKWRRVRATASVLKVLELIVARRRNPDERGDTEGSEPASSWIERARSAERRGPRRRVSSRGAAGGGAEIAGASLGRSRSQSTPAPGARPL